MDDFETDISKRRESAADDLLIEALADEPDVSRLLALAAEYRALCEAEDREEVRPQEEIISEARATIHQIREMLVRSDAEIKEPANTTHLWDELSICANHLHDMAAQMRGHAENFVKTELAADLKTAAQTGDRI